MKRTILTFILGMLAGVAAALLWPRFVAPRLPEGLRSEAEVVEGTVVRKQRDGDRLLLTIDTPQGAALATFSESVAEIDLLVEEGDAVTLALRGYEPFVDNPAIRGVRKADRGPIEDADEEPAPALAPAAVEPAPAELEEWPGADEDG